MADVKDYNYLKRFIFHAKGNVSLNYDVSLKNGDININEDNVTIDGNGHTIDANGKNRIFNVNGKNVVLKNFIFKNGKAPTGIFADGNGYGGAIRNNGQLELDNCQFIDNVAKNDGNDIVNNSELKIINCKFSKNDDGKNAILNQDLIVAFDSEKSYLESYISNSNVKWLTKIDSPSKTTEKISPPESSNVEVTSQEPIVINQEIDESQGYVISRPFDAYEGDEPFVFVSYKHGDYKIVYPIIEKLHNEGINIWYDAGLPQGFNYDIQIHDHIKKSKLFITFITEKVISGARDQEDYVIKELNVALKFKKDRLAIFLENVDLDGAYTVHYSNIQSILKHDYLDDEKKFFDACISAISMKLNQNTE